MALTPTISNVKSAGNTISNEYREYKELLGLLAESDFVKEMKRLQVEIIS